MSHNTRTHSNPAATLLASIVAATIATSIHAAPRPASDTEYQRATGAAPAARPAQRQQSLYAETATAMPAYSANSAISQSIRSAAPNQDKIYQYVSAAVRSDSNTAGVIRDAVGTAPQYAETIVHAAINIRPDQAELITRTALSVAPQEADRVTYAAIAANPRQAAPALRGAMAGAPDKQARITEAARLAASKYRINDPAFEQALMVHAAPVETVVADDDALYYGEERERDDIAGQVVASTVGKRPTLMPRMQRASSVPTPAGNAREY